MDHSERETRNLSVEISKAVKKLLYPNGVAGNTPVLVTEEDFLRECKNLSTSLQKEGLNLPTDFQTQFEDAYFKQFDIELRHRPGQRLTDNADDTESREVQEFTQIITEAAKRGLHKTAVRKNLFLSGAENLTPAQSRQLESFLNTLELNGPSSEKRFALSIVHEVLQKEDGNIYISHSGADGFLKAFLYSPTDDPEWHENLQDIRVGDVLITQYGDKGLANILSRKRISVSDDDKKNLREAWEKRIKK